jgi:hypothetical protein
MGGSGAKGGGRACRALGVGRQARKVIVIRGMREWLWLWDTRCFKASGQVGGHGHRCGQEGVAGEGGVGWPLPWMWGSGVVVVVGVSKVVGGSLRSGGGQSSLSQLQPSLWVWGSHCWGGGV